MFKLFKNKKGSSVIETVMLFPIFLYLLFFSTFKLISYFAESDAQQEATVYARSVIACETPEQMLNQLAKIVYDPGNGDRRTKTNTSITKIIVTTTTSDVVEVDFAQYAEGNATFASYCYIKDGIPLFDYEAWNNDKKTLLESYWQTGSLVEIELSRDLTTDVIKSLFRVQVYDFQKKENAYFTMGVDTDILVVSSNVISY